MMRRFCAFSQRGKTAQNAFRSVLLPCGHKVAAPHAAFRQLTVAARFAATGFPQTAVHCRAASGATTPVAANSHALEVVPKSHLLGLLDVAEHIMTPTVNDSRIKDNMYRPIPVEPGDVIAFSSFLVHRTGEEGDGFVRIALSGRFNNAAETTYVDHGYPTPYKYSYRTDLMFENFPSKAELAVVFPDAAKAQSRS